MYYFNLPDRSPSRHFCNARHDDPDAYTSDKILKANQPASLARGKRGYALSECSRRTIPLTNGPPTASRTGNSMRRGNLKTVDGRLLRSATAPAIVTIAG